MQQLIIGTSNPAKKQMVRAALAPLNISVIGTDELGITLHIEEDGSTAQENARKKSLAYAQALGKPILSIDNALYLEGLPAAEQPGVHTRRVPGREGRASDQDLLDYYAQQVERLGGRTTGCWEFAVCIADAAGRIWETMISARRTFVSQACPNLIRGYPLESLQIDPETGRYMAELTAEEQDMFWQQGIGEPLRRFVLAVACNL